MHPTTTISIQVWLEEHEKEFKVLTWPPNSPHLKLIECDALEQLWSMEANPQDP